MSFLRKLSQRARDFADVIPPEVEREPTIADDYPDKWTEVQWRRQIFNFLMWSIWVGYLILVLFVLYGVLVTPVSEQQRALLVKILCPAAIIWSVSIFGIRWFGCPRCQRTFCNPLRHDIHFSFFPDSTTRCQHCNLQVGDAPPSTKVR